MRQKGFSVINLVIVAACVLAIAAVVYGIYFKGFKAGAAEKQVEWDADNAAKATAAALRAAGVDAALEAERVRALGAEAQAEQSKRLLAEERRRANRNRTPLATCLSAPEPSASRGAGNAGSGIAVRTPPAAGDPAGDRPLRLRVTYEFVFQHDRAFTGLDGQPLPEALAGNYPAERSAASPYTVDDILDVHIANAEACSRDRRSLATLMSRVEAAARAWDKGSQ